MVGRHFRRDDSPAGGRRHRVRTPGILGLPVPGLQQRLQLRLGVVRKLLDLRLRRSVLHRSDRLCNQRQLPLGVSSQQTLFR